MPRHVDAWLDGVKLSSLGPIWIKEVHEDAPTLEIQQGDKPGRYGQRMLYKKRQSLRVAIECQIGEIFNLGTRADYAEKLAKWANGSLLELSNHPGRQLHVYCSAEPTLGEVRDYTSTLRVEFTADEIPYWEDKEATVVTFQGSSGSGSITVPGTVPTPVIVQASVVGEEINESFTVNAGGNSISLSGLGMSTGSVLALERDARDDLYIRRGTSSMMSKRSAASADDLMVAPGTVAISYTANESCGVTFTVRGRWA